MKKLKFFFLLFIGIFFIFLGGCNSLDKGSEKKIEKNSRICPQCHMELPNSNIHTTVLYDANTKEHFDDVGCMILWLSKKDSDINAFKAEVFTNDTHRYINAVAAHYKINEKTPMLYGFSAYENLQEDSISYDEVITRMRRGEHMANPKIRKQILGY
jgi:hypothetical protein